MFNFLKKPDDNISYMEVKEASETMEDKRRAAVNAILEYKTAKKNYVRTYAIAMTQAQTPANDQWSAS